MRSYEVLLLAFGAMAGLTWAMLALFVYSIAGDGLPVAVEVTVLLPLTATMGPDPAWIRRAPARHGISSAGARR